jgi:hypothetical protein
MIIISGGEISNEKGSTITFKLKCEKCGHLDQSETTVTITTGVTEITTKKCPSCGNNQIIKMKHSLN